MTERIMKELEILRSNFSNLEFKEEGGWIRIPEYEIPGDLWNRKETDVVFQVPPSGYPGQAPYGFNVPVGIRLKSGAMPQNYTEPVDGIPFPGTWARFSWQQENWFATDNPATGSNLLNFVRSFRDRFLEGV